MAAILILAFSDIIRNPIVVSLVSGFPERIGKFMAFRPHAPEDA
jgi:hypothetical protein